MVDAKPEERSDICRDFLKNICNRGNRCKFFHPTDSPAVNDKDQDVHFCIDFQNRGCHRENCRFVHVPREEADRYKATKEFNLLLARAVAAVSTSDTINGIPVCKEFQTGKCSRGTSRCRYWHVNMEEERERRRRGLPPMGAGPPPLNAMGGGGGRPPMGGGRGGPPGPMGGPPFGGPGPNNFGGGPGGFPMRRPLPHDEMGGFGEPKRQRMGEDQMRIADMEARIADLVKENDALKRDVQREHERYEDLYALFRQQAQNTGGMGVGGGGIIPGQPMAGVHGVPQQRQQPAAPYGSQMGANMWGGAGPQWTA